MTKIIKSIKPYNEIIYKNCFYHQLMTICNYFNRNLNYIICNTIFEYSYENEFESKIIFKYTIEHLLNLLGIGTSSLDSNDFHDSIVNSINKNNIVILINSDYKSKDLHRHLTIVHGYNDTEKLYYIIDPSDGNNIYYINTTISFDELEKKFTYYKDNLKNYDSNIEFAELTTTGYIEPNFSNYINFFNDNKSIFKKNYDCIKSYFSELENLLNNKKDEEKMKKIIYNFSNFIYEKQILIIQSGLIYNSDIRKAVENLKSKYETIFTIIIRYITENKSDIENISDKLNNLLLLEKQILDKIYS